MVSENSEKKIQKKTKEESSNAAILLAYLERLQLPRKTSPDTNHRLSTNFALTFDYFKNMSPKKKKEEEKKGEREQRIEEKHSNILKSHFLRIWGPLRAHSYTDTQ